MLYLISPEKITNLDIFLLQLEEIFCLEDRPEVFQLRLKDCNLLFVESCIQKILPICKKYNVIFILNDDICLAKKYNVGLHVGKDIDIGEVKKFKNETNNIVGVSCYNDINRALQFAEFASYVSFGAIFKSTTKPNTVICNKEVILEFAQKSDVDIAIIGGISAKNMAEIQDILHIIKYICVISDVWNGSFVE